MKKRPVLAIALCLSLGIASVPVVPTTDTASAASPALSKTKLTVRKGSKKVLKMKNTSRTVTFAIKSGSTKIKLSARKKQQVTITGKKTGTAKVTAKIKYSSKNIKTYTCTVTVKPKIWYCPKCGQKNDTNYCSNCGEKKPSSSSTATATPSPTPTATATATPAAPEALSTRYVVMVINETYYFPLQVYANAVATDFYNRVAAGKFSSFSMAPLNDNERFAYVSDKFSSYTSSSAAVSAGELYLYGEYVLKLATTEHSANALPTRLGRVDSAYSSDIARAFNSDKNGKTTVEFRLQV